MNIEHFAYNVKDPVSMAEWYVTHLGMKVVREFGPPTYGRFLADSSGRVLLEIYCNDSVDFLYYADLSVPVLHLAFISDDVLADHKRLTAAGARPEGKIFRTETGDEIANLRDPWGLALQLIKRAEPM